MKKKTRQLSTVFLERKFDSTLPQKRPAPPLVTKKAPLHELATMELFGYLVLAASTIALAAFLFMLYSGFFYTYRIRCTVPASLPRRIAYSLHTGPYCNCGPHFRRLKRLVPQRRLFAIYYDDPKTVSAYCESPVQKNTVT